MEPKAYASKGLSVSLQKDCQLILVLSSKVPGGVQMQGLGFQKQTCGRKRTGGQ